VSILTIAKIAAKVPSSWKYQATALRPLYIRLLRLGNHKVWIQLQTGTGFFWNIDELTSQTFLLGTYEGYMQAALCRYLRPGSVYFDVGAHAGFHSLVAATLVGPSGRVFAFEPNPRAQQSIRRQVAANPSLPVTLLPYAVLDRCGTVGFSAKRVGSAQSHVDPTGETTVDARTLDSVVADKLAPPPSVIKIDVEGAESAVLDGAMKLITTHRPVVLCDENDKSTLAMVDKKLRPVGYEILPGPPITAAPARTGT
jgi:FkbM family methyltransferase